MENRFHLQSDEEGKRLDIFLAEKLSITRSKVKGIFEEGCIRIEGRIPRPSLKVKRGLVIEGEIPEGESTSLIPQQISLDILYEDEYILAVNKPKGMVVHPSFGHSEGTLVNAILGYLQKKGKGQGARGDREYEENKAHSAWSTEEMPLTRNSQLATPNRALSERPGIVHRLDKGTTGVILIAKDPKTQEVLSDFFKERIVQKTYRTIVEGIVRKNEGVIDEGIGRHPIQRKKMAVVKRGGRESKTVYKILKKLDGFTYIEAYPRTGRTHQIRVHLAHIGHPVAGDDVYGKKAKHITDRPLLHAYTISFPHPMKKGLPMVIEAPVPEDMERFIVEHEEVVSKSGTREKSGKRNKK